MTTNVDNRQYTLAAVAQLGVANIGAGNGVEMDLPPGALLLRAYVLTDVAFNTAGTGTAALTLTDGTTVFANAVDVKTTGNETVANAPKFYPNGGVLAASITEVLDTTAANAGRVSVVAEYVIIGRAHEVQG